MKIIRLWSDGGCRGNNPNEQDNVGGTGTYLQCGEHTKKIHEGFENTTNNKMEMLAMIKGLKSIKRTDIPIEIYSDSAYTLNGFILGWIKGWERNDWKNAKKQPVANRELWEELVAEVRRMDKVDFYKVSGHVNLNKPAEVNKAYKKFIKNNPTKSDISMDEFIEIQEGNCESDRLTNLAMDEIEERLRGE